MNRPEDIVNEMIEGIVYTYSEFLTRVEGTDVICRLELDDKVGLVSGGGSGHEPAHAGFVGEGMLDAAVCGAVFTSPTPDQVLVAIKAVNTGKGVLLIIKNYTGDIMNFEMAKDLAALEGIDVEAVVVDDDIAVEDSTYTAGRRGVAGTVLVHKILGYYAQQGMPLQALKEMGDRLVKNIFTIGLSLSGATVPEVGTPGFILKDNEIEYGVGIHGEPGYRREVMKPSKDLVEELVNRLKAVAEFNAPTDFGVLVNGLGSTPLMEQFVFMNDVHQRLNQEALSVVYKRVGEYMTAIDMQGLSLTLIQLKDSHWLDALNAPVKTAAW